MARKGVDWAAKVEEALTNLGGEAHLSEIYPEMERVFEKYGIPKTKNFEASIRGTIEAHSSDSKLFNSADLFASGGKGTGRWSLRRKRPAAQQHHDIPPPPHRASRMDGWDGDKSFEGSKKWYPHLKRERNAMIIKKAKAAFKKRYQKLFCELCGFDFETAYGKYGIDFIEAHHITPIGLATEAVSTGIADLMMLCSNCHRVVHRLPAAITDKNKLVETFAFLNRDSPRKRHT